MFFLDGSRGDPTTTDALKEAHPMRALFAVSIVRLLMIGATVLAMAPNQVGAACVDGTTAHCIINGKSGTRECVGGRFTPCFPDDGGTPPGGGQGTVTPKYYVLTVVYSPPGTQGGRSSSSVVYGASSTTGTTTSSSNSFKQNYSVSVNAGGGFLGSVQGGLSFSYGRSTTDSQSLEIKKSGNTTIRADGPSQDGINHDHDLIYLWLNPKILLSMTSSSAAWTFTGTDTAEIQYVYVGWLKDPSKMPPGVTQALSRHGITADKDFADILRRDPFAGGRRVPLPVVPQPLDPARFQSVHTTFPYEPPYSATDPVPTYTFSLANSSTSTVGTSTQDDYKVGVSVSGGVDFLGLAKSSLKTEDSWNWTNTSSQASSAGTSESATVTIGGPAFGYTGPTEMEVYYDTVYKTFLFRPLEGVVVAFKGTVATSAGKPLPMREVSMIANGVHYRTFTNAKGEYRFFGSIRGPVKIQAGGTTKTLREVRPDTSVDLRVP
jgi:hypothetical protein